MPLTGRFDLQGHRGARGLFAENTLEGFAAAFHLGFDSFEIDIAITRDGVPVLHHDPALSPAIARLDGRWIEQPGTLIKDLTAAELSAYDVGRIRPGSDYASRYSGQRAFDGARIPTLSALLDALPACRLNIELKTMPTHPDWTVAAEEMAERVLAVIDRAGAGPRVTIQSFDWRGPRHVARTRPDIARGWLTEATTIADAPTWRGQPGADTSLEGVPAAIAAEGGGTWPPFHSELTGDLVTEAHGLGQRVIPWTVNAAEDMRRLIGGGVDGLISDWPDRALPLLA